MILNLALSTIILFPEMQLAKKLPESRLGRSIRAVPEHLRWFTSRSKSWDFSKRRSSYQQLSERRVGKAKHAHG